MRPASCLTGNRRVGRTHSRLYPRLLRRARLDRAGYIEDLLATYQAIGSSRYPRDPMRTRALAERCFDRGIHPAGAARQLTAIVAMGHDMPSALWLEIIDAIAPAQ